jgi:hypothetical protein
MAVGTLYGVVATAAAAGGLANKQLSGVIDARVKAMIDSYVTTGANEDISSTIAVGQVIPKGANILNIIISVSASLGSGSTTLTVGDTGSGRAAAYLTAFACSGAVIYDMTGTYGVAAGFQYVVGTLTGDNQILLTTAGAHNTTASVTIKVIVLYTMD